MATASAQGLRTLHVDALAMHVDHSRLHIGEVFHLAIHVHVREHVSALDELVIPDVGTMQLLGDERQTTHAKGGTDVVETLTLEPTMQGRYTFGPAYLDAIDARTGRPTRFSADRPVTVVVASPAPTVADGARILRRSLGVVLAVIALAAILFAVLALGRLRRSREGVAVSVASPVPVTPPASPPTPRERVRAALRALQMAPGAGALATLRAELFAVAGAPAGATLRDALSRTGDRMLRTALVAAEHAAFGPAMSRESATVELIDATQAWLK